MDLPHLYGNSHKAMENQKKDNNKALNMLVIILTIWLVLTV